MFEFVYFDYSSVNRIENFVSFVSEDLLAKIHSGIWRQIYRRLIFEPKPNEKNPHSETAAKPKSGREFDPSKPLDGVIAHLTREYIRNVHD